MAHRESATDRRRRKLHVMATDTVSVDRRPAIIVVTADVEFANYAKNVFGTSRQIDLTVLPSTVSDLGNAFELSNCSVIVVDLNVDRQEEIDALSRLMARVNFNTPVIVVTNRCDENTARLLLHMRIADFLVKPIAPVDLVRACARAVNGSTQSVPAPEAQIFTFLPAVGGAGVTTLAVQAAMLLLKNHGARSKSSTCLVDLNFQHGAVADYLDIEPRLNLAEIEPRPDRLDRQLLEVMLSYHRSGLAVIAAPNQPAEMRSFDPGVITRLLDLIAKNFEFIVFDMPRTWFSWTDTVLVGSNKLFIVSETTVPALRQAKKLVTAIRERLQGGPRPLVLVNRFERRIFGQALRRGDIEQTLGDDLAGTIPNDYALVREAIDRGVPLDEVNPNNSVTSQLRQFILPKDASRKTGPNGITMLRKLRAPA